MDKIFVSPSRYIQGKDLLNHAGQYLTHFGENLLVLADEFVQSIAADTLVGNLESDFTVTKVTFNGECSMKEIDCVSEIGQDKSVDAVIGVGAGKALIRLKQWRIT